MSYTSGFDRVGVDELRTRGSMKWTKFPGMIGAFVAEMDFGTAPQITQALHTCIESNGIGYLPDDVSAAMAEAVAGWQRRHYDWHVRADDVHPVADVIWGLQVVIEHFSRAGSPVIVPTPAYMPFRSVPPALGRQIIEVPLAHSADGYTFDLEALDAAFAAGGQLLILCNPYNPVGRVFSREELGAISEVVDRHGGRVFADEIHAPLVYPGHQHIPYASISPTAAGHTVTATSASKAWNLPGLKCAQLIISNEADALIWERISWLAGHGTSTPGVIATTAAFTEGEPWLHDVIDYLDLNRMRLAELISQHLPGVKYLPPQGTYIGWLDCRDLDLDPDPATFFRNRARVALTDGSACGATGDGFVRMIFATPGPVLEQAIVSMGAALC